MKRKLEFSSYDGTKAHVLGWIICAISNGKIFCKFGPPILLLSKLRQNFKLVETFAILYSYSIQKRQSISIFFINEKFRWYILFLHLHFTSLCGSWKAKKILKKYLFWKYESWFPSEVTKLTSVCYPQNDAWKK